MDRRSFMKGLAALGLLPKKLVDPVEEDPDGAMATWTEEQFNANRCTFTSCVRIYSSDFFHTRPEQKPLFEEDDDDRLIWDCEGD